MEIKDRTVDISSDHEFGPSEAYLVTHDKKSPLTPACSCISIGNAIISLKSSSSKNSKHSSPSHNQQVDARRNDNVKQECMWKKLSVPCLVVAVLIFLTLLLVILILISLSLAMVFTSIIIPIIIICLVLGYWITSLQHVVRCDDYADVDDAYDTELGSYWRDLVVWMAQVTGILIAELLVYLAIFRIGPFPLRKLSIFHLSVWKWFFIGIIFLVYFVLWCLTRILLHQAREKSGITFSRLHVFPICEALLGVAIWGLYFLVELLVFKLVPPLRRPKILGLYAHRWGHALVYVFIGVNVSRFLSSSIVALLHNHHLRKDGKASVKSTRWKKVTCNESNIIYKFMRKGCINFLFKKSDMGCNFVLKTLFKNFDSRKYIVYVVVGLRRNINFVFVSIWLLATWTSHFEHQLKPSKDTVWVLRVGTATLTCLLICAVLWLLKNSIMLWWKYRSMYSRFYDEVTEAGIKLYFLGMIFRQHLDVLRIGWRTGLNSFDVEKIFKKYYLNNNNSNNEDNKANVKEKRVDESQKKKIERVLVKAKIILVNDLTKADCQKEDQRMNIGDNKRHEHGIYEIMQAVKYFLLAEDVFTKDINEGIRKLLKRSGNNMALNEKHIKDEYGIELSKEDFYILVKQLKAEFPRVGQESPLIRDFETWMERSYRSCFIRASTLASAQRLADYLDQVMVALIILTTFGIWLTMVTNGTKVITILTAPILAVSFMIGDTCSTIFKGIIFSYVIHPYDIGDLCVIQNTLHEVKQIDFWKTTFLKVDTNEVVFYPNSALLNESIINKRNNKGGLDVVDRVEFSLENGTNNRKIEDLKRKIDDFLKEPSTKSQNQHIEDKYDIGKPINMTVHFEHKLEDFRGVSNSECFQEMNKRKQVLQRKIIEFCAELDIKAANEKSS